MSNQPPIEVPQGAIRLNTDSQKLEFYAQDQWWEMATDVQGDSLQGGSGRGLVMQGIEPSQVNSISYIDITNTGTGYDFGDATANKRAPAGCGSRTRALSGGGNNPSVHDEVDYFTFASTGNATDYGDLFTGNNTACASTSNNTRGVIVGGDLQPSNAFTNTMQHITIATTGNSLDFGDMLTVGAYRNCTSDSHGGLE